MTMPQSLATRSLSPPYAAPSNVLAGMLAFFAGCPVLLNLLGTYVADGESFAITAGGTLLILAASGLATLRLGAPQRDFLSMQGLVLALAIVTALFWGDWLALTVLSPSPQEKMGNLAIQSVLWYSLPITMIILWRRWIDLEQVVRYMLVLASIYVIGLTLRYMLGLGHYHSGRWHAGDSLESIRSGHYAALALWIFIIGCCSPAGAMPRKLKLLALGSMPLAIFMVIATNSRGPTLALALIFLVNALPLARLLAGVFSRDARLLLVLIVAVAASGIFVASQIGSVESDFGRLVTLTNDGGSAQERFGFWHDYVQLLSGAPHAMLTGLGYGHGLFYPHNVPLETVTAGGIPLLLLLIAMIAIGFRASMAPCMRGDPIALLFAGFFVFNIIGAQVAGSIATDATWYGALLLVLRHEERISGRTAGT